MKPNTQNRRADGDPSTDTADEVAAAPSSLAETVHRVGGLIKDGLPKAEVAELRRLNPQAPSSAAFWKLIVGELEPRGAVRRHDPGREDDERRWSVIFNALAHLSDLNRPGPSYGAALASCGFSELRFGRLLRARSDALWYHTRRSAQYLRAHGEPADATGVAWLVLSDGRRDEQRARRQMARSYYRTHPDTEGA